VEQTRDNRRQPKLELIVGLDALLPFLLLFGLAFPDQMTEPARMFPVESHNHRLGKTRLVRVGYEHAQPRDGLQQRPRGSKR